MIKQMITLTKTELKSLYGINILRHTSDPSLKSRGRMLAVNAGALILFACLYIGAQTAAMIKFGAADAVPVMFTAVISLLIFFLSAFKAGNIIFRSSDKDIISALPVAPISVVVSRYIRLYAECAVLSAAANITWFIIYSANEGVTASGLLSAFASVLFLPLIPLSLASAFGTVITGISSRIKRRGLAEALLTLAFALAAMLGLSGLGFKAESLSVDEISALFETVSEKVTQLLPLLKLLCGGFMGGSTVGTLAFVLISVAAAVLTSLLASAFFTQIVTAANGSSADNDYRLEQLKSTSAENALFRREIRRYLSSGTYISNTIIGLVMMVILSGAAGAADLGKITAQIPVRINITGALPFFIGIMMTGPSPVSISLEGKNWWIIKSLPVTSRQILDAKLRFDLALKAPFYAVSELVMLFTVKAGVCDRLWLIAVPAVMGVFSGTFGLAANLKFPKLTWDTEVSVVKQSASSGIGMLVPMLSGIVLGSVSLFIPERYTPLSTPLMLMLMLLITAALYRSNIRHDMRDLS